MSASARASESADDKTVSFKHCQKCGAKTILAEQDRTICSVCSAPSGKEEKIISINKAKKEKEERERAEEEEGAIAHAKDSIKQWPACKRAAPRNLMRSATFGVGAGERKELKDKEIYNFGGKKLVLSGSELRQSDLDTLLAIIEKWRASGFNERFETSLRGLNDIMGRSTYTDQTWQELRRLVTNTIEVTGKTEDYIGHFINSAKRNRITRRLEITIDPKLVFMFQGGLTHIDIKQRRLLSGGLALWTHEFTASQKRGQRHRMSFEQARALCGSEIEDIHKFKQQFTKALNQNQKIGAITWQLTSSKWSFEYWS